MLNLMTGFDVCLQHAVQSALSEKQIEPFFGTVESYYSPFYVPLSCCDTYRGCVSHYNKKSN